MNEIVQLTEEIVRRLESSQSPITRDEFEAQKRSFVIGNAFDVYEDGDTITAAKMTRFEELRLDTKL